MKFLLKRLIKTAIGLILLITALYFLVKIVVGEPLLAIYGENFNNLTEASKEQLRTALGFNKSLLGGYTTYIKMLLNLDLGWSYTYQDSVATLLKLAFTNTVVLMTSAYIIIFALALPLGVYLASIKGRPIYCKLRKMGLFLHSMPDFWVGTVLIMIFSVGLRLTPISGTYQIGRDTIGTRLYFLILPTMTIVITHVGFYYNFISDKLVEELKQIYILGIRARGLSHFRIWYIHILKNIISTLLSLMSVSFVHIVGGTYLVEYIFNYRGMGTLMFESAKNGDYPLLIGTTIVTAGGVMLFGILTDYVTVKLDKRMEV